MMTKPTANFEQQEIDKFSQVAHQWWDKSGEFKPLHDINPLRLNWIDRQVGLAGKQVLDVGCGGGILAESMANKGAHVMGIDLSEASLEVARLHALETQTTVHYELISVEALAMNKAAHFDVVTCMEMLEHVPDPAAIITAIQRIVKPGGMVFMSTFNRNLSAYVFAVLGAEYILRMLPRGTHDYQKFITPAELARMARHTVLFDFDGTLLDTADDLANAANNALVYHGYRPFDVELLKPHASSGAMGLLGAAGFAPEHQQFEELRHRFMEFYAQNLSQHSSLYEGVSNILEKIETKGLLWGIVTNKSSRFTLPLVEQFGLDLASVVVCGDTTPNPKPSPEPLLWAAQQLNIDPTSIIYVGDARRDIVAAKAANMYSVAAAYGYCDGENPALWGADDLIHNPMGLNAIDTNAPKGLDKDATKAKTAGIVKELTELQNLLFAEGKHSVLVVVQGMDASGKDGLLKNVFSSMNPMGVQVTPFKAPTELEASHDFLWRIHAHAPAKGMIGVFNRSHYEDVLIQRVHGWITDAVARKRMAAINDFERLLKEHNNTHILKFYLHITPEQQLERLNERLTIPEKMWKHNDNDLAEAKLWPNYMKCYEDVFAKCDEIPWQIIPAGQNWYKSYLVAKALRDKLVSLKMQFPGLKTREVDDLRKFMSTPSDEPSSKTPKNLTNKNNTLSIAHLTQTVNRALLLKPKTLADLQYTLSEAQKEGLFDADTLSMLEGAIQVNSQNAGDIMVPRSQITFINVTSPLQTIIDTVNTYAHSRYPVYEGQKDHVLGILLAKDLLRFVGKADQFDLREDDSDTIGGLVARMHGRVPKRGSIIHIDGFSFEVIRGDARVLATLSFAPFGFWPLQLMSYLVLFVLLLSPSYRYRLLTCFVFATTHFATGLWWLWESLHTHGGIPNLLAILAVILLASFLALFPTVAASISLKLIDKLHQTRFFFLLSSAMASCFALNDFLRGFVLSGLPWLATGYAHTDSPLIVFAPLFGVYGIGFIVFLICALCANALTLYWRYGALPRRVGIITLVSGAFLLGSYTLLHHHWWARPSGKPLVVASIQGNISQSIKFSADGLQLSYDTYIKALENQNVDLVITPESAHPVALAQVMDQVGERIIHATKTHRTYYLLGAISEDSATDYANSAYVMNPEGQFYYRYDKHHLVPFGEYIPDFFEWFVKLLQMPFGEFQAGALVQNPVRIKSLWIAPNICYEDLFGEAIARSIRQNSQKGMQPHILANLTNLGWFGQIMVLDQHLQIGRMRAFETQKPIIRTTNTGITAYIGADGQILAQLPSATRAILKTTIQGYQGLTPYVQWENWPMLGLWTCLGVLALIARLMQRA
ncbi:unnamed protein product, partial [Darwinula stevensoni]